MSLFVIAFTFIFLQDMYRSSSSDYTREILAAVLGTMLITAVTIGLLGAQSRNELRRHKSITIFEHKLKVYSGFVETIIEILADGKISNEDIKTLAQWDLRISLLAGSKASKYCTEFIRQLSIAPKLSLDEFDEEEMDRWMHSHSYVIEDKPKDWGTSAKYTFLELDEVICELRRDLGANHETLKKSSDEFGLSLTVFNLIELSKLDDNKSE